MSCKSLGLEQTDALNGQIVELPHAFSPGQSYGRGAGVGRGPVVGCSALLDAWLKEQLDLRFETDVSANF